MTRRAVVMATGGLAAGSLPASAAPVPGTPSPASAAVVRLRLIETSDLHMFVYDYDYYAGRQDNTVGLAKVATLLQAARAEARNSLLFDNGDILQGNPLGDYMALPGHLKPPGKNSGGHPMFRAMNLLGYDAATFGNHEFNYGLDFLHEALRTAKFPFVCANIENLDGTPFVPPTMVLQRRVTDEAGQAHDLRIGVIGLVTPQIMIWDKTKLEGHIRTTDIVEAAQLHVPALRGRCDLLVALCHSGISASRRQNGEENAALHLAAVPGIDVVFTGHAHRVFPGPDYAGQSAIDPGIDATRGTLAGKPAVMPGFWGSHLGVIDLVLRQDRAGGWSIGDFQAAVRPIYRREGRRTVSLASDAAPVLAAAAPEHAATLRWMEQPVGSTTLPISTYFSLIGNDPSVSLVNAAQFWYARPLLAATPYASLPLLSAAAPFKAGGTGPDAFVDIPAGRMDMKDIAGIYQFANTVCAVRARGDEVREWLERAATIFNRIDPDARGPQTLANAGVPSYMFDVISGVTYAIDLSQPERYGPDGRVIDPAARRIVDLRYQGHPIDPAQEFVVVTNNYRADGGGSFPGTGSDHVVLAAPDLNRDVLVRYVMQHQPVTPKPEPVWHFAPLGKPVTLAFNGNAGTAAYLGTHPGVTRLGDGAGGFVRYGFALG